MTFGLAKYIFFTVTKLKKAKSYYSGLSLYLELVRSGLSLSRTCKGPRDLFEIERVRDREKLVNLRKTEREEEISGYMMNKKLLITVKRYIKVDTN